MDMMPISFCIVGNPIRQVRIPATELMIDKMKFLLFQCFFFQNLENVLNLLGTSD